MTLVEILTAISLFCSDPTWHKDGGTPGAFHKTCRETAWKCIDKVRKRAQKDTCPKSNDPNFTFAVYCTPVSPPDFEECFR